jgi:hypothetical protein
MVVLETMQSGEFEKNRSAAFKRHAL